MKSMEDLASSHGAHGTAEHLAHGPLAAGSRLMSAQKTLNAGAGTCKSMPVALNA